MAKAKAGRGGPCAACQGGNCWGCIDSPENSTPVKLFTPKGAVRALLTGKILKDTQGREYYWNETVTVNEPFPGFYFKDKTGAAFPVTDFSGLFFEETPF